MMVLLCAVGLAWQAAAPKSAAVKPAAAKPVAPRTGPSAAVPPVAAQAEAARKAGQLDEALKLYRQGTAVAPRWADGWWSLGTISYLKEQYPQCRDALQRYVALEPKSSVGLAFLGLCQFETGQFDAALRGIEKAYAMGLPSGDTVTREALYKLAVVQTKSGNFERALQICTALHREKESPEVVALAGLAALRKPVFPQEMAPDDRELIFKMGRAMMLAADRHAGQAGKLLAELVESYPKTPNVNYAYGAFLIATEADRGLDELRAELKLDPNHLPALVTLADELMKRGNPAEALTVAEHAAKQAPRNFPARALYGRALVENGKVQPGIVELEYALKLAPDSPQVHFFLASAYGKAGRKEDAAREREQFLKLKQAGQSMAAPEAK
ncbi:MAG: tetratricopeptide repeat protein [Acidobacteria bacterium]|nr:tetratricopeptide repeat protein [Acidobacteriota bacterium]